MGEGSKQTPRMSCEKRPDPKARPKVSLRLPEGGGVWGVGSGVARVWLRFYGFIFRHWGHGGMGGWGKDSTLNTGLLSSGLGQCCPALF